MMNAIRMAKKSTRKYKIKPKDEWAEGQEEGKGTCTTIQTLPDFIWFNDLSTFAAR